MIEKSVIEKTLSLWGISNTKTELIAYRENVTFKAQDNFGNRLVLRFHRKNYSHKYEIVSELLWLEELNEKNINVPKQVKSIQNKYIEDIEGQLISLLTWIN